MEHVFASLRPKEDGNKATETPSERRPFGGDNGGARKPITRHSREFLQQQNLISKFLYHSLALEDPSSSSSTENVQQEAQPDQQVQPIISSGPAVQEDSRNESERQDSTLPQPFSKNIMWTFEDLRMLIGTDLPIFGGGNHPCISLRLR